MAIRGESIYIQTDTWRCLWLLSKAKGKPPDEIADDFIRDALHREYPALTEFQSETNKRERTLIKRLGGSDGTNNDQ